MRLPSAGLFILLSLAACGRGNVASSVRPSLQVTNTPDPSLTFLKAFGDSITAGYYGIPSFQAAYVSLAANYNHLPLADYASPGDEGCDVPTRQIFGNAQSPSLAAKGLYTIMIGTNDASFKGTGDPEAVFNLCEQAAIAWLGVPQEFKVLATAAAVTTSGPTHLDGTNHWNALTTDGIGATMNFPFKQQSAGAVYAWYRIIDGNGGSFSYSLDGVVLGTKTTGTTPGISTLKGETDSLALLRLPHIAAGNHVLTFQQTAGGASGAGVVAVGTPAVGDLSRLSKVMVGTPPRHLDGNDDATVARYMADVEGNADLLAGDGLDVALFYPSHFMTSTSMDMSDNLHPNALGHQELFAALESGLR